MENNQHSELPELIFQGLAALETLDLGHNNLAELPANIFHGPRPFMTRQH